MKKVADTYGRGGQSGGVYEIKEDSVCFTITSTYLRSPKFIMEPRQLTETRTDEAKEQRREAQKQGKDYCSRRGKVLVPRADEEANCVTAVQGKEHFVMEIDSLNPEARESERVHKTEGISPTLRASKGGTSGPSTLVMEQHTVAYSKSTRDEHIDIRGKVNGEANTISTGDGGGNMSTQNFVVTHYGHKNKEHQTHNVSPTLKAQSHGHEPMAVELTPVSMNRNEGIKKELDTSHCLSSSDWRGLNRNQNQTAVYDADNIRIRKLTPIECERLQGWPDGQTQFGRKPNGQVYELSNTQRYRICGNGVTASVSAKILDTLIPNEEVRVLSLFSGGGGTELALPDRFTVVGHCEFDAHASAVLHYHWPNVPNFHDVTKLVEREDVPEFDLLTFGFPCQAFSIAGLRQGFADDKGRGNLIYNVFDIIQKHKPKYLLGENVKGLLSHDKGDTFEAIMEGLSMCGYDVDFELVNSKHFGVAQNRERVFIFGRRRE